MEEQDRTRPKIWPAGVARGHAAMGGCRRHASGTCRADRMAPAASPSIGFGRRSKMSPGFRKRKTLVACQEEINVDAMMNRSKAASVITTVLSLATIPAVWMFAFGASRRWKSSRATPLAGGWGPGSSRGRWSGSRRSPRWSSRGSATSHSMIRRCDPRGRCSRRPAGARRRWTAPRTTPIGRRIAGCRHPRLTNLRQAARTRLRTADAARTRRAWRRPGAEMPAASPSLVRHARRPPRNLFAPVSTSSGEPPARNVE